MRSIHALLAFCLLCAAATAGTAVAQGPVPASAIPPAIRVPTDAEKQRLDVAWRKIECFDASAYPKNTLAAIADIRPLLTETYGPEHPITLRLDTLQAGSLARIGKHAEAEALFVANVTALERKRAPTTV